MTARASRPARARGWAGAALLATVALALPPAGAADDPDLSALKLADDTPEQASGARAWRLFVEGAVTAAQPSGDGPTQTGRRVSLGGQYDAAIATDWRVSLADQLDLNGPAQNPGGPAGINTFKEGYLSWQARDDVLFDLGRVNVRNGVATGYNPTDFFKEGALRSVISVDPASLRENRQGSVVVRAQELWSAGSVTALYAPRLASRPDTAGFSPDWGATNGTGRWLLSGSAALAAGLSPQWLLYKKDAQAAQGGVNATALLGDATVAYAEGSAGRSPSMLSQALAQAGLAPAPDTRWRPRVSAGATWTAVTKFAVTGELEFNGGGLNRAEWDQLQRTAPQAYGVYRRWLAFEQEPATRRGAFAYARWQDAMVVRLDLSAMARLDLDDRSTMTWLEARYRLTRSELALQWQRNRGSALSDFGAAAPAQAWQAEWRCYF